MNEKVDLDHFKSHRTRAYSLYLFTSFCGGILETAFYSTEYLYLKDTIKTPNPTLYFGLGSALQHLSGMVVAFVGSMYYDRTLHIRRLQLTTGACIVLASVLYILPYSVWLVIVGNLLYGCISIGNSATIAEIVHIYPEEVVTSKVAIIGTAFAIGLVAGQALVYAFVLVHVKVGSWTLTFGNMPALVIGSAYLICVFLILYFVHDLALMYDVKQEFEDKHRLFNSEDEPQPKNRYNIADGSDVSFLLVSKEPLELKVWIKSYLKLSCSVILDRHFAVLLFTTAIATFSHFLFLGIIVVEASNILHWDAQKIANLRIIMACGAIVACLTVQVCTRCIHDYYMLLGSVVITVVALCVLGLLPFVHGHTYSTAILYFASAIYGFLDAPIQITARAMVAKLAPSKVQGIAEATRFSLFQGAQMISGLGIILASKHLSICMFSVAVLNALNVAILLGERKFYTCRAHGLDFDDITKKNLSDSEIDEDDSTL